MLCSLMPIIVGPREKFRRHYAIVPSVVVPTIRHLKLYRENFSFIADNGHPDRTRIPNLSFEAITSPGPLSSIGYPDGYGCQSLRLNMHCPPSPSGSHRCRRDIVASVNRIGREAMENCHQCGGDLNSALHTFEKYPSFLSG